MNIRIISNSECLKGIVLNNDLLMQKVTSTTKYDGINKVQYYFYDSVKNKKVEMLPSVIKYDILNIKNMIKTSLWIFFTTIDDTDPKKAIISLKKYNVETEEIISIYSYIDNLYEYNDYKRIRIFVINDFYLLIQNEYLRDNLTETYRDYLEFEQFLYSVNDKKIVPVYDENLKSNGIEKLKTISDNLCVIKTGFSLLKDNRYEILDKFETSVETVSFINMSQFVSDLLLGQRNIVLDTLDQVFYTETIPYISVKEDYIVYSKLNIKSGNEELVFYNYKTKEAGKCINDNVNSESDLAKIHIISGIPHLYIEKDNKKSFYNLLTNKFTMSFSGDYKIEAVFKDIIILSKKKKSIFKKEKNFFYLYQYPKKNLILSDKGNYCGYMITSKDDIYIFTK